MTESQPMTDTVEDQGHRHASWLVTNAFQNVGDPLPTWIELERIGCQMRNAGVVMRRVLDALAAAVARADAAEARLATMQPLVEECQRYVVWESRMGKSAPRPEKVELCPMDRDDCRDGLLTEHVRLAARPATEATA